MRWLPETQNQTSGQRLHLRIFPFYTSLPVLNLQRFQAIAYPLNWVLIAQEGEALVDLSF